MTQYLSVCMAMPHVHRYTGACPGIRKGGGPKIWSLFFFFFFFFAFQFFRWGGPAQKRDEKMIFWTKKVAKYRWNSLKFRLMTFFFAFQFLGGGARPLAPPPPGHGHGYMCTIIILCVVYDILLLQCDIFYYFNSLKVYSSCCVLYIISH